MDEYSIDVPVKCKNCKNLNTRKQEEYTYHGKIYHKWNCYSPVGDYMDDDCEYFSPSNHPDTVEWELDPHIIKETYEAIKDLDIDWQLLDKWKEIYEIFKDYLGDN